jgi:hypothetical protein
MSTRVSPLQALDPEATQNPLNPPTPIRTSRTWYIDEIVVAAFAFLGFGGAVFLPLKFGFNNVPPVVVSFLLATGLAALAYRYLGGIPSASFSIGALKLSGALAALVGIALLINSQLLPQTSVQVWYLRGKIMDHKKDGLSSLADSDFSVFPANAHAEQLGDFHVEYIRHPMEQADDRTYLIVNHPGFGKVTIPLEVGQLKSVYPDVQIHGTHINIDHIVLPEPGKTTPYAEGGQTPQPLSPNELAAYAQAAGSAKHADPMVGGIPQ